MRLLLLASHAVAEFDDLRMFSDLGFDVWAPGGYEVPSRSGEGIRPALPDAPHHPDLVARLQEVRAARGEPGPAIDWGKAALHDDIIDWADAIIVHHFPEQWIVGQWDRIKHKRVIWRTCGQSDPRLEMVMEPLHRQGLQIVRYSPAERRYFEAIGQWAGQDALIRFGKYPDDYGPWIGDNLVVGNITQHMKQRGDACGYPFWVAATEGLPVQPAGAGSDEKGGLGPLSYPAMLDYLRHLRAYLYTGTTPASYTLGLIEAMLSGVPTIPIGPVQWAGPDGLFEGHEIANVAGDPNRPAYTPEAVRMALQVALNSEDLARIVSDMQRAKAIELFSVDRIGAEWSIFLEGRPRTRLSRIEWAAAS